MFDYLIKIKNWNISINTYFSVLDTSEMRIEILKCFIKIPYILFFFFFLKTLHQYLHLRLSNE